MTPLDAAHAAMAAAPGDDLARLAYYEALASAELVIPIEDDAPDTIRPTLIETDEGRFALAFDGEERMAALSETPLPYAALPGRVLVAQLAGTGLGLGVNLTEPSAFLMPATAVAWLATALAATPAFAEGRPDALATPRLPQRLLAALDRRLARAGGLAGHALLAAATWPDGRDGHLLAVIDAEPGAEGALAQAVSEALIFSGLDDEMLDLTFLAADDTFTARLGRIALRFDLPKIASAAPGSDPAKPPRLR